MVILYVAASSYADVAHAHVALAKKKVLGFRTLHQLPVASAVSFLKKGGKVVWSGLVYLRQVRIMEY